MIDCIDSDSGQLTGRTEAHAPEVDGVVYIENVESKPATPTNAGAMLDVKITGASEYDLIGETLHG
jgi:tRNA A37 methylthiotransferase MiaB